MKVTSSSRKKNITRILFITQYILTLTTTGCKKLIEVNAPTTQIAAKNVYTNNETAAAVLTAIYTKISASALLNADLTAVGFTSGLSSDELTLYSNYPDQRLKDYYQNNVKPGGPEFWGTVYSEIYIANAAVDGISNSTSLASPVKKQLLGEAKFTRALCYFYLVNLYGDIPLVLGIDYTQNRNMSRTDKTQVWQQIINDLTDAKSLLSTDYLDGSIQNKTTEKVRPTKWAATALLARSYLYNNNWKNAEEQAADIIDNSGAYKLDSLQNVFLRNSNESIWQLQPVNVGSNTEDAKVYVLPSTGPRNNTPVYLSPQLVNSFEANDKRKTSWVDTVSSSGILYYFPYKYKVFENGAPVTEYNTVFRLGEQFLIRAEARAQQGNLAGSRSDLNIIRNRAGLKPSEINEKDALLTAIYHERQVELFTEWGHRWMDLKRTKRVDAVMTVVTPLKGGTWNANWQLYPLPTFDIQYDGNLKQNIGY